MCVVSSLLRKVAYPRFQHSGATVISCNNCIVGMKPCLPTVSISRSVCSGAINENLRSEVSVADAFTDRKDDFEPYTRCKHSDDENFQCSAFLM